jgi:hypothetical protein
MIDTRDGTLLMIGRATNGIVVAADSAGTSRNEVESCRKIHPVGKFGAFLIRGNSAFRYESGGKVAEELDLVKIIVPFLASNTQETLASALSGVSNEVVGTLKGLFSKTHLGHGLNAHLTFAGYDGHVPSLHVAQFLGAADQNHEPTKIADDTLLPGFVLELGDKAVANEILTENRRMPAELQ